MMESVLSTWRDGGTLLIPIAVVSILIGLSFFRLHSWLMRLRHHISRALDDPLQPNELCSDLLTSSFSTRTMQEAFDQRRSTLLSTIHRELFVLKAFVGAAPLLGLLGTVIGMMITFDSVASTGADKTAGIASGIREALLTTQFGLVAALPGVFGVARIMRLRSQIQAGLRGLQVRIGLESRRRSA